MTTVERSLIDTLRVLPLAQAQPVLDRALLKGWFTVEVLARRCDEFAGRRGVSRLRTHLARVEGGARSEAERTLHELLESWGITGWFANHPVTADDGTIRAVLDAAFPAALVAIEIDGLAFHTDPERFQRDRTRQNWLVNNGWTVLRFTWDDLRNRAWQVRQAIETALNPDR